MCHKLCYFTFLKGADFYIGKNGTQQSLGLWVVSKVPALHSYLELLWGISRTAENCSRKSSFMDNIFHLSYFHNWQKCCWTKCVPCLTPSFRLWFLCLSDLTHHLTVSGEAMSQFLNGFSRCYIYLRIYLLFRASVLPTVIQTFSISFFHINVLSISIST